VELTFVVGTGRCGSTMLSRLLREHPDVLSMSEFFSTLRIAAASGPASFPAHDMDGAQLWRLLASPFPMLDAMISDGLRTSEMLYPDHGRFDAKTGIPLVSHYILPMLGADPDELFDELAAEVPRWPRRPAAVQYQNLFGYLAGRLGRPVMVERSAASLHMIPLLHAQFPAARFVHLYRDGPDCALSMSRHPAFRREILAIGAVRTTTLPAGSTLQQVNDALPERFRGLICPPYDARKLRDFPIPVEVFGRDRWSPMICAGVAALAQVPGKARTSLRYEDLLAAPAASLSRLAEFIGISAPEAWLKQGDRTIDPSRTGTAVSDLDAGALARLQSACEPGTRALAAAGISSPAVRSAS
jgi:Sulfotransferase family